MKSGWALRWLRGGNLWPWVVLVAVAVMIVYWVGRLVGWW
jgi:hypothetical protein